MRILKCVNDMPPDQADDFGTGHPAGSLAKPVSVDMSGSGLDTFPCKVCSADAVFVGSKVGKYQPAVFKLFRCPQCGYACIANPWLDYKAIYSEAYYKGHGADPLVDYVFELENPRQTIRQYEWRGILKVVQSCVNLGPQTRWLDFGCGNGGLVRYCREQAACAITGFDEGWISNRAVEAGIPVLTRESLDSLKGSFDVITAIEVLEHVADPILELQTIRSLLKPGGLFFLTTGNAAPFRAKLLKWRYLIPELHISLFEPRTLVEAFKRAQLKSDFKGFLPGYTDIIRFKVLKTLGIRKISFATEILPWPLLSRLADWRFQVTGHPVGWADSAPAAVSSMSNSRIS